MFFSREEANFLCFCCECFLEDEQLIPMLAWDSCHKAMPSWFDEYDAESLFVSASKKLLAPFVSAEPLSPEEVLVLWYALSYTVNTFVLNADTDKLAVPIAQKLGDMYEEIWPALPPSLRELQREYLPDDWDDCFEDC